jgi:hypothetical protein
VRKGRKASTACVHSKPWRCLVTLLATCNTSGRLRGAGSTLDSWDDSSVSSDIKELVGELNSDTVSAVAPETSS